MEIHEFRAVLKHFYLEGITATDANARLVAVHGNNAPSNAMVKKWFAAFKRGEMDTCDAPRSGRPKTVTTEDNVVKVKNLVIADRRITTREIAEELKISQGSVYTILHENLGLRKLKAKWVPRHLKNLTCAVSFS
jgi:histone-lysine N-methyltransferase SETMAR